MKKTIKNFVLALATAGLSAEDIQRLARAEFPGRIVTYGYVAKLRQDAIDIAVAKKRLAEFLEET